MFKVLKIQFLSQGYGSVLELIMAFSSLSQIPVPIWTPSTTMALVAPEHHHSVHILSSLPWKGLYAAINARTAPPPPCPALPEWPLFKFSSGLALHM